MNEANKPPGTPAPDDAATMASAAQERPTLRTILRGKYQTSSVLGEGAFGRVYLATDTHLRSNVAIKELLAERNSTDPARYEQYLDRFQREARAARVSQHPNIVTVYDLDTDESGNYYLVMEYVEGTDLRMLLKSEGALSVERAVALAIEIAQALAAVHEQEIVHRDLKPANIMITRRGNAKLTDFGIAQVGHESMRTRIAVGHPGTPMYMSPEQASGQQYLRGTSDLYSLGLILYEMLVGTPYVRTRQPLDLARPETPPALVRIVNKLIAADSEARYQYAADVVQDLKQLTAAPTARIADDATHAVPTVLPTPITISPRRLPRRRRMIVAGSGIVAGVMIVALVLFAVQRNEPPTAPTAPAPTAIANSFTVADTQNGISFAYPQDWQSNDDSGSVGTPYSYTSKNPFGQFRLFVENVDSAMTLDTYADSSLAGLLSNGSRPGSKGKQSVTVAGQAARLIDAVATQPTGDLFYYYQYITLHDGHAWNLAFLTALSETDAFQKQSNLVVNSFAFCPTNGCPQRNTAPKAAVPPTAAAPALAASSTPAALPANLLTVADSQYLISFAYPQEWRRSTVSASMDALYSFTGTNPVGTFMLTHEDVLPGTTLDAYVDSEITTLRSDPTSKVGPKGRQTTTVAGQDARLIDVLVPMKNRPQFSYVYQYILLRNNRIWTLTFGTTEAQADAFKAKSDAVVSSFGFCPVNGCTQTNTAPPAPTPSA